MDCDNISDMNNNNVVNNIKNNNIMNNNMEFNIINQLNQKQLLQQIREYSFSIVDLSEYLDTHPCDQKALMIHNEYANKLKKLKEIYEKKYTPLTIYSSQDSWKWIEGTWPWEKGGV